MWYVCNSTIAYGHGTFPPSLLMLYRNLQRSVWIWMDVLLNRATLFTVDLHSKVVDAECLPIIVVIEQLYTPKSFSSKLKMCNIDITDARVCSWICVVSVFKMLNNNATDNEGVVPVYNEMGLAYLHSICPTYWKQCSKRAYRLAHCHCRRSTQFYPEDLLLHDTAKPCPRQLYVLLDC